MKRVPVKAGLFTLADGSDDVQLLGSRCGECARVAFPAQSLCPYCGSEACAPTALSRAGVVEVCTTVVNRPPGYEGQCEQRHELDQPDDAELERRVAWAHPGIAGNVIDLPVDDDHHRDLADGREQARDPVGAVRRDSQGGGNDHGVQLISLGFGRN